MKCELPVFHTCIFISLCIPYCVTRCSFLLQKSNTLLFSYLFEAREMGKLYPMQIRFLRCVDVIQTVSKPCGKSCCV